MSPPQDEVEALLEYLKRSRGFDFTGYKRASLERRIARRMQMVGVGSFSEYTDYLEVHPDEFGELFNTVLINVTSFFRDTNTWEFISGTVVPDLVQRSKDGQPLRVWSAGCASGEEAYTLAMIFAEALGLEAFKEQVKIYATDVDEDALGKARQATYADREVAEVPPALLEKYFETSDGQHQFRKDLRRQIIFGRHDLIQDAPISRVDMLVCRNTLMYFNAETQARILARFQFALNDHGVLFLGRAETLMTHAGTFAPLDLKRRVSTKLPSPNSSLRDRLLLLAQHQPQLVGSDGGDPSRLREIVLDSTPIAQIVVNADGSLVLANERARSLFGLTQADISRPLQDLKISYRPVELRSAIEQVSAERRPVVMRDIEWTLVTGESRWLDVHILPVMDVLRGALLGATISFTDVSSGKRLQRELEHAKQELETAYEELQSTNEELETTNEELQSTVEELETTNEELQATNEELETMNEELQSTNEELQSMNDELRERGDELNQVNAFLESILASVSGAVIVVDSDLKILVWNPGAEDLWGLREDELRGKNVLGLDIGLPTERLKQPLRACLSGQKGPITQTIDAVNRRGRAIACHVSITPLVNRTDAVIGAILVMEDQAAVGERTRIGERAPPSDGKPKPSADGRPARRLVGVKKAAPKGKR
jgi:two-component system, chemotaxis family, CheB/CheR fusion protein